MDDSGKELLRDALGKARKLLAGVRRQQEELVAAPKSLAPSQLDEGRQALENAARAAQKTVNALENALNEADAP